MGTEASTAEVVNKAIRDLDNEIMELRSRKNDLLDKMADHSTDATVIEKYTVVITKIDERLKILDAKRRELQKH